MTTEHHNNKLTSAIDITCDLCKKIPPKEFTIEETRNMDRLRVKLSSVDFSVLVLCDDCSQRIGNLLEHEKEKTITWFFRAGAEVEVNGKTWIAKDDRAQIAKKYSNDEDFQTVRNAPSEFDKMEEEEFRIHNSENTFFFEKEGGGG